MTSCLRIVPKFSTPSSRAMPFKSVMLIACNLAMFSDAAILSRCGPRRSSNFGSSPVGSTGVEGGCRAAEPEGSTAAGVSAGAPPLMNSGDSVVVSSATFTFVFFVETLGISQKLVGELAGITIAGSGRGHRTNGL